jgi:TMEM175 potassium channel family protein
MTETAETAGGGERSPAGSREENIAGFSRGRLDALFDGVLAIVLTLLVFDLHAPITATNAALAHAIATMAPQFISFVITFAVAASFWYGHRIESHWLIRSDRIDIAFTMLLLLGLAFVPFSASLLGRNMHEWLAVAIYGANLAVLGLLRFLHYCYSTAGHRLVTFDLTNEAIRAVRFRLALTPVVYLVAIGISPLSEIAAVIIFALMPLNHIIPVRPIRGLTSLPHRIPTDES